MQLTCQSEFGKIRSVFIKNVEASFVDEKLIKQEWKALNFLGKPDLKKAKAEYKKFEDLLKREKAEIKYFPHDATVSIDSIYCRDAAIATDHGVILCNMGKKARVNEPGAEGRAFEKNAIKILGKISAPGTVEGGDVTWLDSKTLAVGLSYRTNQEGINQLKSFLNPKGITVIKVSLPHYKGAGDVFHLMSIISPVDRNLAVVYSPLMPIAFRKELLTRGFKLVEVPDKEFESMGCNVLAIAPRKCIMVRGNPRTKLALIKAGCTVHEYVGKEISVKGGGGPTCLTRPMLREI